MVFLNLFVAPVKNNHGSKRPGDGSESSVAGSKRPNFGGSDWLLGTEKGIWFLDVLSTCFFFNVDWPIAGSKMFSVHPYFSEGLARTATMTHCAFHELISASFVQHGTLPVRVYSRFTAGHIPFQLHQDWKPLMMIINSDSPECLTISSYRLWNHHFTIKTI